MDIIWTSSNDWFSLPSLESSNFYYDATCLNNWFFQIQNKGQSQCICIVKYSLQICTTHGVISSIVPNMKEQSWDTIIYHVFNHGNHILQNRIGINLIYISFLSVILSCLIYVICVRLHSFVVSNTYLCYLSNTHCLFFFFLFFSSSCSQFLWIVLFLYCPFSIL